MPEKAVEEKEKQEKGATPPPAPAVGRVHWIMRAVLLGSALSWGATVAYMLLAWAGEATGKEVFAVGEFPVTVAHLVGAAVAAALGILGFKKFDRGLEVYKPQQARMTRIATLLAATGMILFGSVTFYRDIPDVSGFWWHPLGKLEVFGKEFATRPILFPSIALMTTLVLVLHLLLNRPRWAEYQIDTEGELRKVSWPPRKEFVGASVVVVFVVAIVSMFLYLSDLGLSYVMKKWGIGF